MLCFCGSRHHEEYNSIEYNITDNSTHECHPPTQPLGHTDDSYTSGATRRKWGCHPHQAWVHLDISQKYFVRICRYTSPSPTTAGAVRPFTFIFYILHLTSYVDFRSYIRIQPHGDWDRSCLPHRSGPLANLYICIPSTRSSSLTPLPSHLYYLASYIRMKSGTGAAHLTGWAHTERSHLHSIHPLVILDPSL